MAVTEQTFSVSASSLFDTLVDPATYPQWLVGARHIRSVSREWPQPTSHFEHTVGFGPIVIPDRTTVRKIDPPRTLELLVRARPLLEAVVRFDLTPSPTGCTLRMHETPAGVYKLVSAIAQPLIRARNERSMKRLKALIEAATTPVPNGGATLDGAGDARPQHPTGTRQARENAENELPA